MTCTSAGLASGAFVTWTIKVHIGPGYADGATLSNTAAIATNATADPIPANDSSTATVTVNALGRPVDHEGRGVTTVTAGDGDRPAPTRSRSPTPGRPTPSRSPSPTRCPSGFTQGTVTDAYGLLGCPNFTCTSAPSPPGHGQSITVTYTVPASTPAGDQTNTATVHSPTDPSDPRPTTRTRSRPSPSLSITKDDGVTTVTAGDGITRTYTITVSNAGPSDAQAVTVTDTWPVGLHPGDDHPMPTGAARVLRTSPATSAPSPPGTTKSITVTYTVPASTPAGDQTNTAKVHSPTDPSDSTATDTNTVATLASLSITKDDGVTTYRRDGVTCTYTITVSNAGPSDAQSVTVADRGPRAPPRADVHRASASCPGAPKRHLQPRHRRPAGRPSRSP